MVFLIANNAIVHIIHFVKRIRAHVFVHLMLLVRNVTNVSPIHMDLINTSAVKCVTAIQWVYRIMSFNVTLIMALARKYLELFQSNSTKNKGLAHIKLVAQRIIIFYVH